MDGLYPATAVFCLLLALTEGFNSGPPVAMPDVCTNMFPSGHGPAAQTSTNAVTITLGNTCYKEGHTIPVTVQFNEGNLMGIFVQARQTSGNIQTNGPQGTFESSGDSQPMKAYDCNSSTGSAWGHSARLSSSSAKFNWKAPSSDQGNVRLVMTVVKDRNTFWTFQQSAVISYSSTCEEKSGGSISAINYTLLTALMVISTVLR